MNRVCQVWEFTGSSKVHLFVVVASRDCTMKVRRGRRTGTKHRVICLNGVIPGTRTEWDDSSQWEKRRSFKRIA